MFIKTEDLKLINSNICIFDIIDIIKSNIYPLYNYDLFNQKPIDNLYIKKTIYFGGMKKVNLTLEIIMVNGF